MKQATFFLLLVLSTLTGHAQADSLQKNSSVMRATLIGVGHTNILDTYLSPVEYTGIEARVLRESMRMTQLMGGKVSTQNLLQINFSSTTNQSKTGDQLAGLVNWSYAWHYQFHITERLKLLAGPMIDLNGGFVYNMRNSNNPAQAKAYLNLAASGMAIYRLQLGSLPLIARYQLNVALAGILFSPEYGQSYYEIFTLGHWGKNILFTSLHNQPSFRQMITLDIPIHKINLRVGYLCDIQQSHVNSLKSHTWSNLFMIGFVKNFSLLKGKSQLASPTSATNPY
ncbi:MAG: DUF3316 domain-containing protein [Phocaeicola sp.]